MTTPSAPGNPEVEKVQAEIETVIEKVEVQEAKVENASTPKEAEKESDILKALHEKFDALNVRLNGIDKRLAEPTVPAPPAKEAAPVFDKTEPDTVERQAVAEGAKPRKRRLGAWG